MTDINAEDQIRRDIEADREQASQEAVDILAERTEKDRLTDYANSFRASLGDLGYEASSRFDDLLTAIGGLSDARSLVPTVEETEPEPEVEPAPEAAYRERPPAVLIPLSCPFSMDGVEYEVIEIRPPTYGDVQKLIARDVPLVDVYGRMTGLPVVALNALRLPDAERVIGAATDFIPDFARKA